MTAAPKNAKNKNTGKKSTPEKMPRPNRVVLIGGGVLVVALVLGGFWWSSYSQTPAYSIARLSKATQGRDWNGVQKYLDVNAVVGQIAKVDARKMAESQMTTSAVGSTYSATSTAGPKGASSVVTRTVTATMVAGAVNAISDFMALGLQQAEMQAFQKSVQDGSWKETDTIAVYFTGTKPKSVTYDGGDAIVTVGVQDVTTGPFDVRMRMTRSGKQWKVVSIENVADLPSFAQR